MRDWTPFGHARQVELVRSLKQKLLGEVSTMREMRGGNNGGNANDRADLQACGAAKAMVESQLIDAEALLARIRIAPTPRQTKRGQVGLEARIRYLDNSSRHKRGMEESCLIGGKGESDDDEILRTYSCDSPLGRALVNAEVGDERTVTTPSGDTYDIKIVSFAIPAQKKVAQAA